MLSIGVNGRRCWGFAVMAAAMFGLMAAFSGATVAQDKKAEKAKTTKETKEAGDGDEKPSKTEDEPEPKDMKNFKVTVPKRVDKLLADRGGVDIITMIDEQVADGWVKNKIQPAERCSDYTFVRRAHLDLIGRIPTTEEISKFMRDPAEKRRALLIERLIGELGTEAERRQYGDEFGLNFGNMWTTMLLTRSGSQKAYQGQIRDWMAEQFIGGKDTPPDWAKTVHALISASGQTNENPAVNYILHHLGDEIKENTAENGKWDAVPVTSRTTRLFLGVRTQCVQCHDHPFNGEWGQKHFWQINAFMRQIEPSGRPSMMAAKAKKGAKIGVQQYTLKDNPLYNSDGIVSYERRNGLVLYASPIFLDGRKMPKSASTGGSRRTELATFVTTSPYFAKSFINRTWGHFFGKSFTKDAVDDFGEHNPESLPELLTNMAETWSKKYQHNPKTLIRWICNSQAYGLESKANKHNSKSEDEVFFARMLLKPMNPEQLFDSLMTATQAGFAKEKEERKALRETWLNLLVQNFGNDEGEEGSFTGTVVQALLLMNGQDINKAIQDQQQGTVAAVLRKKRFTPNTARESIKDLYLAALSREPSEQEYARLLSPKMWQFRPQANVNVNSPQFWTNYYQDIFWSLVNSNEFILNH